MAAGVNVRNFSSARPAPLQRLRVVRVREIATPHGEIERVIGRRDYTRSLIVAGRAKRQDQSGIDPREQPTQRENDQQTCAK
jgi:hypothetical protein